MLKRFLTVPGVVFAFVVALALAAPSAQAQDQTYYTYVSEWAVPRAQWAAFEKERDQSNSVMQRMVADGTLVAWGNAAAYVHTEDGYTHADWFTATSRANVLKVLEAVRPTATGGAFTSVTKHEDVLLHTLAHGGKTSSGSTGYLRVTFWQAKPGEGDALQAHFKKAIQPLLDTMVADGTILMYNFDEEDIHTSKPGGYNLALLFPTGDAIDKFFAALEDSEKSNPAVGQVIDALTVSEEHRDSFDKVTSYEHK
jgi:hypothetical protein